MSVEWWDRRVMNRVGGEGSGSRFDASSGFACSLLQQQKQNEIREQIIVVYPPGKYPYVRV